MRVQLQSEHNLDVHAPESPFIGSSTSAEPGLFVPKRVPPAVCGTVAPGAEATMSDWGMLLLILIIEPPGCQTEVRVGTLARNGRMNFLIFERITSTDE